ncbi:MAG: endonuclease III [Nitrososphaerales archaeon]
MPKERLDAATLVTEISNMLKQIDSGDVTALDTVSRRADPFKVLIATILSHRTRDKATIVASENLFRVYSSAKELSEADISEIEALIKPVGFYRVKAKRIKEVSKIIYEKYGGVVPDDFNTLLSLPSVGRKTANCVLVYGFGRPAIPVDTHVHRISNRLGLVSTKTPYETEEALKKVIDVKFWLDINDLLVRFGQKICKPIKPKCDFCTFKRFCRFYQSMQKQIA